MSSFLNNFTIMKKVVTLFIVLTVKWTVKCQMYSNYYHASNFSPRGSANFGHLATSLRDNISNLNKLVSGIGGFAQQNNINWNNNIPFGINNVYNPPNGNFYGNGFGGNLNIPMNPAQNILNSVFNNFRMPQPQPNTHMPFNNYWRPHHHHFNKPPEEWNGIDQPKRNEHHQNNINQPPADYNSPEHNDFQNPSESNVNPDVSGNENQPTENFNPSPNDLSPNSKTPEIPSSPEGESNDDKTSQSNDQSTGPVNSDKENDQDEPEFDIDVRIGAK